MGCLHTRECPLFPLLNASLRDWRDYYCDSADGWRDCARYKLSTTGRLVPITLLPNGSDALHLRDWTGMANPGQVPPPRLDPRAQQAPAVRFEQPPPPAREAYPAARAQVPHHSVLPPRRPTRRRWWTRLADWITGPA
jgi:hypothetical protein